MMFATVKATRRGFLIATAGAGAGAAVSTGGCGDDGEPDVVSLSYERQHAVMIEVPPD